METKQLSVKLLANDTEKSVKEIERAITYDNYMNANVAIAFGICDGIETSITH